MLFGNEVLSPSSVDNIFILDIDNVFMRALGIAILYPIFSEAMVLTICTNRCYIN